MCVGSVCTHLAYNDTNPSSVFFSKIKPFVASLLCDVKTQAPVFNIPNQYKRIVREHQLQTKCVHHTVYCQKYWEVPF